VDNQGLALELGICCCPYSLECREERFSETQGIAPVRYVYPLSRRTGAIGDVGQKGLVVRVSKPIE